MPIRITLPTLLLSFTFVAPTFADAPNKSPGGPGGSSPSGGGSGLAGTAYLATDLPKLETFQSREQELVLCYQLRAVEDPAPPPLTPPVLSPVQPFLLEPAASFDNFMLDCNSNPPGNDPGKKLCALGQAKWNVCTSHGETPKGSRPLLVGDVLIIVVDATNVANRDRLRALSINVATVQGSAINPAPVRSSLSPLAGLTPSESPAAAMPDRFFLKLPFKPGGDSQPTVTISAVYTLPSSSTVQTTSPPSPPCPSPAPAAATQTTTTSSAPPADQIVTLLNLTLDQVHPRYYYNVSTGVLASNVRNVNFYRVPQPPSGTSYATQGSPGDRTVAPAILFTVYTRPMDAESPWTTKDLIPGVSFGFSLTSPASSFYLGLSSEVRRNVQLVAGVNWAKVNSLAPSGYVASSSSTAPVTEQRFASPKGFVGFTLNIDFIKGLFGAAKPN
jgi:hypothetical protein